MKKIFSMLVAAALVLTAGGAIANNGSDLLYSRTTVHADGKYDTAALPEGTVDLLLNAAFSAPSGGNQLSNNYYVITDRDRMATIQKGHPYSQPLDTAPMVIVVAGDEATCKYPELLEMDAGLAAGAMQAQATLLGLSSCVMSIYPQEERVNAVREACEMPETMKPVLMVAFGVPAVDSVSTASVYNYNAGQVHRNGAATPTGETVDAATSASVGGEAVDASSTATVGSQKADILYERTTVHANGKYDTAALPEETIEKLLNAAFSAPSGGNQLSNNYYVLTERDRMATIQKGHPYSQPLDTAPVVIVVAGDEASCKFPELLEMDAGLSAMAMQIQATELGLSSCVMSIYPQDERVNAVREACEMPETMKPVLMVAFGVPAADSVSSASVTNYDASKVH